MNPEPQTTLSVAWRGWEDREVYNESTQQTPADPGNREFLYIVGGELFVACNIADCWWAWPNKHTEGEKRRIRQLIRTASVIQNHGRPSTKWITVCDRITPNHMRIWAETKHSYAVKVHDEWACLQQVRTVLQQTCLLLNKLCFSHWQNLASAWVQR